MNIYYIVGGKPNCDWFDLKCSLRSVEQYGKNVDEITVVGEIPTWLSDKVHKWNFKQPYTIPSNFKEKHRNLQETLRFIVSHEECPEEFIVGFTDVFLTKEVDFDRYPYYAKFSVTHGIDLPKNASTEYQQSLLSTRQFLKEKNLPVKNMTIHRFIKVNKNAVLSCEDLFEEINKRDIDVEPFVLIGNCIVNNVPIVPIKDYKIVNGSDWWKTSTEITDCFSVRSFEYGPLYILLKGAYPNKCDYEQ